MSQYPNNTLMNVFTNIRQMLHDRGYNYSDTKQNTYSIYTHIHEEKNICLFNTIYEFNLKEINNFKENYLSNMISVGADKYIVLCDTTDSKITKSHIFQRQLELSYLLNKNIELCLIKNTRFNITNHDFVPLFEKVKDQQTIETTLKSHHQLPKMLLSDPISRYYDFQEGDIVKITRKNYVDEINDVFIPLKTISYRVIEMDEDIKRKLLYFKTVQNIQELEKKSGIATEKGSKVILSKKIKAHSITFINENVNQITESLISNDLNTIIRNYTVSIDNTFHKNKSWLNKRVKKIIKQTKKLF